MSETVASGGRVWSPFTNANAKLRRVNIWVFIFCIALPFIGLVLTAFVMVVISAPLEVNRPESIAGGWTDGTSFSGSGRNIISFSLVAALLLICGGLFGLLYYFRISPFLSIPLIVLGVPLMAYVVSNIMYHLPDGVRPKASDSGPTFKEWAHDTYGYNLTSSTVHSKDGHEYVEATGPDGKPTNINVFRDGDNTYLYENTFQLNDTLTKINAAKTAKDGAKK